MIKAVDDYQDLLRISVATAGNDHRLGANEAPPAVVSVFLGDELTAIMEAIAEDRPYSAAERTTLKLGVDALPRFARDNTDRNRTSPFAFTGNKFEFRMVGSSDSIACANIMINTSVAESLCVYADRLEAAEDFETALHELIRKTFRDHRRIVFNGNGYDDAWLAEAERRGLCNYRTTADALPHLLDPKNAELLTRHGVYSMTELTARCESLLENYCKTLQIETKTMLSMARQEILPAIVRETRELARDIRSKREADDGEAFSFEKKQLRRLSRLTDEIDERIETLAAELELVQSASSASEASCLIRDKLCPAMEELRKSCDAAEPLVPLDCWPFPSYGKLMFGV